LPQTRSLQRRIAIGFAGLIVGLIGAAVFVPLALWPGTDRAETIQRAHAEAVRALAEVRDATRMLRAAAVYSYQSQWDASLAREEQERAVAAARDRVHTATEEYFRVPRPPSADRVGSQLAGVALEELDGAAEALVAASRRPGGDPVALQRFRAAGASVDRVVKHLEAMDAAAAQGDADRIHGQIRLLRRGYLALAAVGSAGALLLLFQMLALLRAHTTATERHVTALEAFAGQVSHDLRTPLGSIQLAAGSIERRTEDPAVKRLAARARASVGRLDEMIRDLLHFARSGGAAQVGVRSDVGAVVLEVGEEFHAVAERAGVTLTSTGAPLAQARIAAVALKTILANLVENAIKYRRPDGERRVEVRASADADHVIVEVKDNGVGIPPAILPRIFDPFFRGARRPDSFGLGLATVRRLVESHQGTIAVESEEGRGSTFSVTLPRAEPPNGPHEQECVLPASAS
jgi:two-component system sensor histidine kinase SenX3